MTVAGKKLIQVLKGIDTNLTLEEVEDFMLRSFLAALALQKQELPKEVTAELNPLSRNLDYKILDSIVDNYLPLLAPYEEAFNYLVQKHQREQCTDVIPDDNKETKVIKNKVIKDIVFD